MWEKTGITAWGYIRTPKGKEKRWKSKRLVLVPTEQLL